tara:strand:+ start:58 stop:267 length:210 start_codon:yes stop_codon:yes gene_type:complete
MKYWDLCDLLFRSNWEHCDAETLHRMISRYLDRGYDAGPEAAGIIREYVDNYHDEYEGKQKEALLALCK